MDKIKAAVIGYGNIGVCAVDALEESGDMEVAGIVVKPKYLDKLQRELPDYPVVDSIEKLSKVDVALLCIPSVLVPEEAGRILKMGINTVDSYDIHGENLVNMVKRLDNIAKEKGSVSISGAGWDPGTDSMVRAIFEIMAPKGITYTNFGPGMSMGHTVEAKKTPGVKKALSLTVPKGLGFHKRLVYVELAEDARFDVVEKAIKENPYFKKDETHVIPVEDVDRLMDNGHGVLMERKGVAGKTHNQQMEYRLKITNPAVTAQVMVCAARAAMKQKPGSYVPLEIPLIDYLPGDRWEIINRLV